MKFAKLFLGTAALSISLCMMASLCGVNMPSAYAAPLPVTHVSGYIYSNQTWTADRVYMIDNPVTISQNVTLTIRPSTIIKVGQHTDGIRVQSGGTLNAIATASSQIHITSYQDDSLGGDSNGDGPSYPGLFDYYSALDTTYGSINLKHVTVGHAYTGLHIKCTDGVTNVATDNIFNSSALLEGCRTGSILLRRNQFAVQPNTFPLTVGGNSWTDPTVVELAGSNKNIFRGQGRNIALNLSGNQIWPGSSWEVDPSSGVKVLFTSNPLRVQGDLRIKQGIVLKSSLKGYGVMASAGAHIYLDGTIQQPVVFASYMDDSQGGDTNGDGHSEASNNDYNEAIILNDSTLIASNVRILSASSAISSTTSTVSADHVDIDHTALGTNFKDSTTEIKSLNIMNANLGAVDIDGGQTNFANLAITQSAGVRVSNSARVILRGNLTRITGDAVQACAWYQNCSVDAAFTDWGSASGPQGKVCGKVATSPWKYGSSTHNGSLFVPNCDNSPTPAAQLNSSITNFRSRVNTRQIDCNNGFQDACNAISTAYACLSGAVNVAASTSPWPLPPAGTAQQVNAFGGLVIDGAATYMASQESVSVPAFSLAIFNELNKVVGTMVTLGNAYGSCAP